MLKLKVITGIIIGATMLTSVPAFAKPAESPTHYTVTNPKKWDYNTEDYKDCIVVSEISGKDAIVYEIRANKKEKEEDKDKEKKDEKMSVDLEFARDPDTGEKIPLTELGERKDGRGVFNSKYGQKITEIRLLTKADLFKINENAFRGSHIERIVIKCKKVLFKTGAFKKTLAPDIQLVFDTADQIEAEKGAFEGLDSITLICEKAEESEKAKDYLTTFFDGKIEIGSLE